MAQAPTMSTTRMITAGNASPDRLTITAITSVQIGGFTMRYQPSRPDRPVSTSSPTLQTATSQPMFCTSKTPSDSRPKSDSMSGIGMNP